MASTEMTAHGGEVDDFAIADGSRLRWRETPWNDHALKQRTLEIVDILDAELWQWASLLHSFTESMDMDGFTLCATRIPAGRQALIAVAQSAGFKYVETTYRVQLPNLQRFRPPPGLERTVSLRAATSLDISALQEIAANDFHHGRFLEDPGVPFARSRDRQKTWVEDLFRSRACILVHDGSGGPDGFMAYRLDQGVATLELGGCRRSARLIVLPFWVSVLYRLQREGVNQVQTMVSVANVDAVNLYAALAFRVREALVGLHRHAPVATVSDTVQPSTEAGGEGDLASFDIVAQ